MNSKRQIKLFLIIFGIAATVITAIVILHKNYLMPWQIPLYKNRKATIKYVRENHPDSKIYEEHIQYRALGYGLIILELKPDCYITFEENGFQYRVFSGNGRVLSDNYRRMKFWNDIEEFIDDKFLDPRGIEDVDVYCSFNTDDEKLPLEWSEYDDNYEVTLRINNQGIGIRPQDIGWLYSFYRFWDKEMPFSQKWYLTFDVYSGKDLKGILSASWKSNYKSANEMYSKYYVCTP